MEKPLDAALSDCKSQLTVAVGLVSLVKACALKLLLWQVDNSQNNSKTSRSEALRWGMKVGGDH